MGKTFFWGSPGVFIAPLGDRGGGRCRKGKMKMAGWGRIFVEGKGWDGGGFCPR